MSSQSVSQDEARSEQFLQELREVCLTKVGIDVRFLSGPSSLRRVAAQLDAMAASERLSVRTRFGPWAAQAAGHAPVTRFIVPPGLAAGPSLDHLRTLGEQGTQIRVSARATRRLIVVDRSIAMADLSGNTGRAEPEGVLVHNADLIRALVAQFEEVWRRATPLSDNGPVTLDRFTPRQRRILELLAQGMTDQTVSRDLGLSARSVRAEVTTIRQLLGAGSRFEAGVRYAALRAK